MLIKQTFTGYWPNIGKNRHKLHEAYTFGRNYFYKKPNANATYSNILRQSIDQSIRKYVVIVMLVIFSALAAVIGPMYDFVMNDKHSTIVGGKLPYFERGSNSEFTILSVYQMVLGSYALLGNIGIEIVNTLNMDMINVFVQTTKWRKDNLTQLLRGGLASDCKIRRTFKSIVQSIELVNE